MAKLPYPIYTERIVGQSHPVLADTASRALRAMVSQSGYDPDADPFPGLHGPVFNIRAFGAKCDGSDDTTAWTNAISAAAASNGCVWHPGGISGVSALTFPPLNRTRLIGQGPTKSIIKDISGNGLIVNFSTHLANEWYSGIEEMTIDGGGFAGPLLQISRASLFIMRNVAISNCTGTCLQFSSLFDCFLENIFVSNYLGPIGTTASAVVFDTVTSPAGEEFDHCTIIDLHVEANFPNAFIPVQLIGNGTNSVRYLRFYDLKVHTDPNAGTPAASLLKLDTNATDNEFHGLKLASGNAAPQVLVNGSRNVWFGGQANTGTALKATGAFSLVGSDNRIIGFNINDTTYSTADFIVSGSRNRIIEPIVNSGGPILANSGTQTVFTREVPGIQTRGDVSVTMTPAIESVTQVFNTNLTADRTATVGTGTSGSQWWTGAYFDIVRQPAAGGSFRLDVRDPSSTILRVLSPGEWCRIQRDDTNWKVIAGGFATGSSGAGSFSFQPNYKVIAQTGGLNTVATSDTSIASVALQTSQLALNGHAIRVKAQGRQVTQAGSFNIKFGATVLGTVAPAAGESWSYEVVVLRTGPTTQLANGQTVHGTTLALITAAPAETLSNSILLDFRGSVTSGGTLNLDSLIVEYLNP